MTTSHDIFLELCAGYALDVLDADEKATLEAHLSGGCDECEAAVRDYAEASSVLASTAPLEEPPSGVMDRVFSTIREEPREVVSLPRERQVVYRLPVWSRIAMTALVAASLLLALDGMRIRQQNQSLETRLQFANLQIEQLESNLDEKANWAEFLTSSTVLLAKLAATDDGDPEQTALAIYDPETGSALVALQNIRPPQGKDYQLWAIEDGAPTNLGVIDVGDDGRAVVEVDTVGTGGTIAAFAVSLEPEGGSPTPAQPSGPVVLVGALGD